MAKKKTELKAVPEMDNEWEAKCDYDTLVKAEEIKNDSSRFEKAMAVFDKQKKAFTSLEQVKAYKNDKYGSKADEDDDE